MTRSELQDTIANMPMPCALFRVVKVPEEYGKSLYEGDVLYTIDGEEFFLSMHDYETARPDKVRAPIRGGSAREHTYMGFYPSELEFVEYDYL